MRPELAQLKLRKLFSSPEELLTNEHGFGLATATPLQRALVYVVCGQPIPEKYLSDPEIMEAFGGVVPKLTKELILCSAIRCAKTLISVTGVTWDTQHCRMPPGLRPGETPRVSLVSKYTDQAEAAMAYLKGAFHESPALKLILLDMNSERILVRHPSGAPIEIMVIAGARSGTTLISRWMAGMIFDEAPRISSESDGVVNLEDMRTAVMGRVLDGSMIRYVGSPVGATGTIYKLVSENWQNPDQKITVVRAKGPAMNPSWWTPERCEWMRLNDPDGHKTDVLAEFLDPESSLFTHEEVERAMTLGTTYAPELGRKYTACMDPATRGNAWTLCIADTTDNRRYRVVFAKQWQGSQARPLNSIEVIREVKTYLDMYGVKSCLSDQWACDPIRDIARVEGLEISPIAWTTKLKTLSFLGLKARYAVGAIETVKSELIREDMLRVKKRISGGGDVQIKFEETADGRHADFAPTIAMLCGSYIEESPAEAAATKDPDDDWPEPDEVHLDPYQEADLW